MGCSGSKSDGGAQNTTNKPEGKKEETVGQVEQTEQKPAGSSVYQSNLYVS